MGLTYKSLPKRSTEEVDYFGYMGNHSASLRARSRNRSRPSLVNSAFRRTPSRNISTRCKAPHYQSPERTCRLDAYRYHIDDLIRRSPKITAVRIGTQLRAFVDPDLEISQRALREYVPIAGVRSLARRRSCERTIFRATKCSLTSRPSNSSYRACSPSFTVRRSPELQRPVVCARVVARRSGSTLRRHPGRRRALRRRSQVGVFDNAKTAVTRILRGRIAKRTKPFAPSAVAWRWQWSTQRPPKVTKRRRRGRQWFHRG